MPRGNDAHTNKSSYSSTSYPPSPPAQLPTPLPDERLQAPVIPHAALYASRMEESDAVSPLIDFDTPTPPQPMFSLPLEASLTLGSDLDNDAAGSRSPPFREAPLPQDSPPPLPIRPRASRWTLDANPGEVEEGTIMADDKPFVGHSRTPTLSRSSSTPVSPIFAASGASASTLENLSRTIRGYVPSIPTSVSSSSNSRSVSIGLPSTSSNPPRQHHRRATSQQEFERDYELYDEDNQYYGIIDDRHHHIISDRPISHSQSVDLSSRQLTVRTGSSGLAQAMQRNIDMHLKPPPDQLESIIWARWDGLHQRRFLIVGYLCGLQVWDCTDLSSVDEVLNLNFDSVEWRTLLEKESGASFRVVHAAILPSPNKQSISQDPFKAQRPLLGILLERAIEGAPEQTVVFLYSVQHKHQVVKRLSLPGVPSTFVSNEYFTVISTTNPSILHILSSTTFQALHEIPSTSLELFIPQVSFISPTIANVHSSPTSPLVLTHGSAVQDQDTPNHSKSAKAAIPVPVFALSHRLLAYASSATSSTSQESLNTKEVRRFSSTSNASASESSASSPPFGFGPPKLGQISSITSAGVGHAALKVGESVFSGMKHFGGMALEAAKNRVTSGQSLGVGVRNQGPNSGKFVSRSAPENLSVHDETEQRQRPSSSTSMADPYSHPTKVSPSTKSSREKGHHVTVVDLAPLLDRHKPSKIDEILVSTSQPAAKIEFSGDGTSIGVALRDGHSTKVFKLKPSPHVVASSKDRVDEGGESEFQRSAATLVYDLHRGRTSAVIECIVWARDGRYVGIGTMNRTVHIYAVNPYGGKADVRSHLEGRVRNVEAVDPTINLTSIARLRGSKTSNPRSPAALAFTFITDAELVVAPNLFPLSSPNRRTRSPPLSGKHGTNHQHVLLFDPEGGVLSLHRLTLEKASSRDPIIGGVAASIHALGVTSMSFPDTSNLGRLSTSPSAKPVAVTKNPESSTELSTKVSQVATYNLRRGRDWDEVTKPFGSEGQGMPSSSGGDWLAEAELSTCSSSQQIVPRSIYRSHQFSFYTLGEDYHALIRSYQLHVSGNKIDVRKEVEVRTAAWNITAFAEGFSSALDSQHVPSSFDEPISSAISGAFDNSNIPHILPMYPNGVPGANVKSLRSSIPIRAISGLGDGVTERIRKEMQRVRAARVALSSDTASVPLEFGEDDEFFEQHGQTSQIGDGIQPTPSHIHSNNSTQKLLDADVVGTVDEELFDGWDVEDKQAIDEVEQFQDIATSVSEEEERKRDKRKMPFKK